MRPNSWEPSSAASPRALASARRPCLDRPIGCPPSSAAPRLAFLDPLRAYAILGVIPVHTEQALPIAQAPRRSSTTR